MTDKKTLYVAKTSDGWIRARLSSGGEIPLPYGLKLKQIEIKDGREHFDILEGVYKNQRASIRLNSPGTSNLTPSLSRRPAAKIVFNRKDQTLYFNNHGPYNAFSGGGFSGYTVISPGTYQLAIPSHPPKETTALYEPWTKYHKIWFRIGLALSGSRFLHPGSISHGCVTVRQFVYSQNPANPPPNGFGYLIQRNPLELGLPLPAKSAPVIGWDRLVDYLILCRASDQSVGILVVN